MALSSAKAAEEGKGYESEVGESRRMIDPPNTFPGPHIDVGLDLPGDDGDPADLVCWSSLALKREPRDRRVRELSLEWKHEKVGDSGSQLPPKQEPVGEVGGSRPGEKAGLDGMCGAWHAIEPPRRGEGEGLILSLKLVKVLGMGGLKAGLVTSVSRCPEIRSGEGSETGVTGGGVEAAELALLPSAIPMSIDPDGPGCSVSMTLVSEVPREPTVEMTRLCRRACRFDLSFRRCFLWTVWGRFDRSCVGPTVTRSGAIGRTTGSRASAISPDFLLSSTGD